MELLYLELLWNLLYHRPHSTLEALMTLEALHLLEALMSSCTLRY